jgi:hypothetical protein
MPQRKVGAPVRASNHQGEEGGREERQATHGVDTPRRSAHIYEWVTSIEVYVARCAGKRRSIPD